MAISDAKKAYRKTPAEKARRTEYLREYRQRPEVKARDALRAQRRRAAPGGADINRQRVKDNRARLGRNYITELIHESTGLPCKDIPDEIVNIKREALVLRRLANDIALQITSTGESHEA